MKTLTITERKAIKIISYDYEAGHLSMITTHGNFSLDAPKEAILRFFNGHKIYFKNDGAYIKVWKENVAPDYDKSRDAEMEWEDFVETTEPTDYEIKHYAYKLMELWKRI